MTMRYLGGGHRKVIRIVDFKRNKDGVPAVVKTIEYDPNRSARIALLFYADGEKRYNIAPKYRTLDGDKEKFRIGSVDSFQGKEFDIVILSTVRSNSQSREDGNEKKVFGFLTLENRLNVAFSRAQKLVIVVGDANMFEDNYAKKYVPGLHEFCTNITKNKEYGNRI